jgi:uncharacterized protein
MSSSSTAANPYERNQRDTPRNDRRYHAGVTSPVVKLGDMSPLRTDTFDLSGLRLTAGEGRRLDLHVAIEPLSLAGESYPVRPGPVGVRLDISRTTGDGYALRLRFEASLSGPCMRCLEPAEPTFSVDAREVSQPIDGRAAPLASAGRGHVRPKDDGSDELTSPYVVDGVLDLRAWARDALALSVPANLLCRRDCAGLCPVCGANLNEAGAEHHHERPPDPRWAALSELRFE